MPVSELLKHCTLYEAAKILGLTPPSVYKWNSTGKVPLLRVYQLRELRPQWFEESNDV